VGGGDRCSRDFLAAVYWWLVNDVSLEGYNRYKPALNSKAKTRAADNSTPTLYNNQDQLLKMVLSELEGRTVVLWDEISWKIFGGDLTHNRINDQRWLGGELEKEGYYSGFTQIKEERSSKKTSVWWVSKRLWSELTVEEKRKGRNPGSFVSAEVGETQ
jgi:hypothetical protein